MRARLTTTIGTYALLCLAGAGSFVMPDRVGPDVVVVEPTPIRAPAPIIDQTALGEASADALTGAGTLVSDEGERDDVEVLDQIASIPVMGHAGASIAGGGGKSQSPTTASSSD